MKFPNLLLILLLGILSNSESAVVTNKLIPPKTSRISLPNQLQMDDNANYILAWEFNPSTDEILFEVEANTTGYVGFGISPQGSMLDADIFIGGVNPNGTPYYSDRIGIGFTTPKIDDHEDWKLLEADESGGITYLKFSRPINSCDKEDYAITNDTNRLIWSMGETDTISYHSTNRGSRSISLLGAPTPTLDLDKVSNWAMRTDTEMPSESTSYWCSFHKGPILPKKHHMVAIDAYLDNPAALKHTHHFILYNCYLPADSPLDPDDVFANKTVDDGFQGSYCYGPGSAQIPNQYCKEYLFVWAKGGKTMVFPEHVGYPISAGINAGKQQYYMLEVHYDNPEQISNLKFKTGTRVYYTDDLRPIDAGLMTIGHQVDVSLTVPPNTKEYIVAGHCSPTCTELLPPAGVTAFNVLLHAHLAGRSLRLRHFRGNIELPWIDFDNHYDFDYQQNKHLPREVKILPGDQITYECHLDSTWKNGMVVSGGMTTTDEMCETFVWYYPKNNFDHCTSHTSLKSHFDDFGVTKYHRDEINGYPMFTIDEPAYLAGDYDDSISHKYNWTEAFKEQYYQKHRFGGHQATCKSVRLGESIQVLDQKYPANLVEYVPEDKCAKKAS